MNRSWSNWIYRLFKNTNARKTQRAAHRAPALRMEHLEDRVVPAVYNFNAAANTLTISLDTGESLAVTEDGINTTFTLSTGTFTATGDTAPVSGAGFITIADTDLTALIAIDDGLAITSASTAGP